MRDNRLFNSPELVFRWEFDLNAIVRFQPMPTSGKTYYVFAIAYSFDSEHSRLAAGVKNSSRLSVRVRQAIKSRQAMDPLNQR